MKQKRIYLWDNTKFLLILLVVIGHFIDFYTKNSGLFKAMAVFIYTFHMPLFIMISGMFHKNERIPEKVVSYIAVGAVTRVLISVVTALLNHQPVKINFFTEGGIPWFMYVLAVYAVISYLLRKVDQRKVLVLAIVLACIAGFDSSIGDFLCLSRILVFYPFYVLGGMLTREKLFAMSQNKKFKMLGAGIIVVWGAICVFAVDAVYKLRPLFTGKHSYQVLAENLSVAGPFLRLMCLGISIALCLAVVWVVPTRKLPVITKCGSATLQVYFWHWIFILFVLEIPFVDAMVVTTQGKLVYLLIAVMVTLVLSLKPFAFPTKWIMSLKERNTTTGSMII